MPTFERATPPADVDAMHALQMRAFEEEVRRCGTRDIRPLLELPASIAHDAQSQLALVAVARGP